MLERIIAKIDNDFNPDNSDWIPRVGAWVVDAMSMMNVTIYETKKERVKVRDKIGRTCFPILGKIRVYDKNGCEIKELSKSSSCDCKDFRTNFKEIDVNDYVVVDKNTIELGKDTDFIIVEYKAIKTNKSETYGCDLPEIPDNAYVIEAITYFCMYKMLTRGYRHPVMNLSASQYGTNPYYEWLRLSKEARIRYINDLSNKNIDNTSDVLNSAFYLGTFGE